MSRRKAFALNLKTEEAKCYLKENPGQKPQQVSLMLMRERLEGWEKGTRMLYSSENERVEAIKSHISQGGKIAPLIIKKYSDGYGILDGWHRASALKDLGIDEVLAYVL